MPEFELLDTGVFEENRYFDIFIEYAKHNAEDILIQIKVVNRGPEAKNVHVLPTLWFRNTWSWEEDTNKPSLRAIPRALSRFHAQHPYTFDVNGSQFRVDYEPAESTSGLFGGNSNWRGPVWFPVNFLLIESLQKFHHYLGDDFKVECPMGSGKMMNLWEVASELSQRLTRIFLQNPL